MEIDIEIDKMTNSIEDVETGEVLKTLVLPVNKADLKDVTKKNGWKFDWKLVFSEVGHTMYKLVTKKEPDVIQGLIALEKDAGFMLMNLIETAPFNFGKNKKYFGVPLNLVAYGCKLSKEYGFDGVLAFDSKTALFEHYEKTLGAVRLGGSRMAIFEERAQLFIDQYFPETEVKL